MSILSMKTFYSLLWQVNTLVSVFSGDCRNYFIWSLKKYLCLFVSNIVGTNDNILNYFVLLLNPLRISGSHIPIQFEEHPF
jgi:hypothetical protein